METTSETKKETATNPLVESAKTFVRLWALPEGERERERPAGVNSKVLAIRINSGDRMENILGPYLIPAAGIFSMWLLHVWWTEKDDATPFLEVVAAISIVVMCAMTVFDAGRFIGSADQRSADIATVEVETRRAHANFMTLAEDRKLEGPGSVYSDAIPHSVGLPEYAGFQGAFLVLVSLLIVMVASYAGSKYSSARFRNKVADSIPDDQSKPETKKEVGGGE